MRPVLRRAPKLTRYVEHNIMQRIFSSAARRTILRARRESERRGGELKIDWTEPPPCTTNYGFSMPGLLDVSKAEGRKKAQRDGSCLAGQRVGGLLGGRKSRKTRQSGGQETVPRLSFSQTPKLLINWGLPPFFRFPWSPFFGGPDCGFRGREILAKLHHLARLALLSGDRRAQRRCEPSSVAICTDVRADNN